MPVIKLKSGFKVAKAPGKFKTRVEAEAQLKAIKASQAKKKKG